MMTDDFTLAIVLAAAIIDAINPCAIGVILFLSSVLLKVSSDRRKLLHLGAIYIVTVYIVYTLSGLGLIWFQHTLISQGYAEIIGITVGGLVIVMGLIDLKQFFCGGQGLSLEISATHRQKIVALTQRISVLGIITLSSFVALVELPCTGGPYLAITALLAKSFDLMAFVYLLIYNVIFVSPLLAILLLIYFGASTSRMKKWREMKRKWMNLAAGILMISLGILLILFYVLDWYL